MTKSTSKPSNLSEEIVQDSGDEDGEAMSGVEGRNTNDQAPPRTRKPLENGRSGSSDTSSDSDSSQESSSAASDASSRGQKRLRAATTANSTSPAKRPKNSTFRVPAQPFIPPLGFEPLKADRINSDLDVFDDLDGKQVWHISAPASVDLTQIQQLDIAAALRGESILTTNGISYGMQPSTEHAEVLLLPSSNPVTYKQKSPITRAFRLKQVHADSAKSTTESSSSSGEATASEGVQFTAQTPGTKKEPRKQPERLGYRFTPVGVEKPVPRNDDSVQLAESNLLKAAARQSASPEKRKKEKKKKRTERRE